jgi:hypothetical protein
MPDTDKATRKDMEQESPQELVNGQRHEAFLILVGRVAPAERDLTIFESNEPVIGDGDAMRVAAEILQDMLGPAKGTFGVDDPVTLVGAAQERVEEFGVSQCFQLPMKAQSALLEGVSQCFGKPATKDFAQHFDWKKEVVSAVNPAGVIWR